MFLSASHGETLDQKCHSIFLKKLECSDHVKSGQAGKNRLDLKIPPLLICVFS